ncbi:hypothetical protein NL676_014509 [Syzygium grande]|nr:hypothetical protein NL676_014509 [Syzygium grande]
MVTSIQKKILREGKYYSKFRNIRAHGHDTDSRDAVAAAAADAEASVESPGVSFASRAPAGIPPGSLLGRERPPPLVAVLHFDGIAIAPPFHFRNLESARRGRL